jgi:signal transduction histidine kinase
MNNAVGRLRLLAEPLIAAIYLVIWLVVNWPGTITMPIPRNGASVQEIVLSELLIALGIAAAVVLCRIAPTASLVIISVALTLQLADPAARFGTFGWGAYLMFLVVGFGLGRTAQGRLKWIGPAVLAVCAVAVTALLVLPRFSPRGIAGLVSGAHASTISLLPQLALWSLVWTALLLVSWSVGYWMNRSRGGGTQVQTDAVDVALNAVAMRLNRLRLALWPVIAVVFYALWINAEIGRTGMAPWPLFPLTLALVAGSIALSRILPRVAIALGAILVVGQLIVPSARFSSTSWPVYAGLLLTCLVVSASATGRIRWLALPLTAAYALSAAVLMTVPALSDGYGWTSWSGDGVSIAGVIGSITTVALVGLMLTAAAWFVGFGYRAWMLKRAGDVLLEKAEDELRAAELDLIVSRERDRIAQDVHDIMAHSLSVIIAQADGARFVGPQRPEAITESLERIAGSARTSLTEVRMLIESLVADPDGHSTPAIDDLDSLIERMRDAGLDITVDRFGDTQPLTPTQQLAVYRIAQEALTNSLKHAGTAARARLTLDWRGPGLALSIASHGQNEQHPDAETRRDGGPESTRVGRGLYGMRERARLAGGWLTAGSDDEPSNGYLVTAFIPASVDNTVELESDGSETS